MAERSTSGLWRIARWLWPAAFFVMQAPLWGLFFLGHGIAQVTAYYLLTVVGWVAAGSALGVGLYAVLRRRRSAPVLASLFLSAAGAWPLAWTVIPIPFPRALAATSPSATVRLPLTVPLRVCWGGDELDRNYHRATADQTWAYDLVVDPALHGAKRNEDFGCWGQPVVAPCAALVVRATDGADDHPPGEPDDPQNPAGNHVALDLDGGFLLIGHLQRGSVAVKTGEVVAEGQLLGRCGNSGNTSEPHVHLHLQRQDPTRVPFGFAEGLPLFFRDHDGPLMPAGGIEELPDGGAGLLSPLLTPRPQAP